MHELITTPEGAGAVADQIRNTPYLAFDTEFIRESTFFPILEILQIATRDGAWLIDAQAFRRRPEGLKPILDILLDPATLKIAHSAGGDQECLISAFGIAASPLFDTSIGASLCGYGDGIGLGNLLKLKSKVNIQKGHARTNWGARPLQEQLLQYAIEDVKHLVDLGVGLLEDLETLGRKEWALALSAKLTDVSAFYPSPEELASRLVKAGRIEKKKQGVLLELMKWREGRVRELNIPRRWLADDSVLIDLTHVMPKDMEHLSAFRGLSKGEIQKQGKHLLDAIRVGLEKKDFQLPKAAFNESSASPEESRALELLRCFTSLLCDRQKIALKHVASASQLLVVLRTHAPNLDALRASGVLSAPACDLVGRELVEFMQGRLALSVENGQAVIVPSVPARLAP